MASSLSRIFRWQVGRQDTGYDKMLILGSYWPLPFDCYLLRFNTGSEIPPHLDQVTNGRHYRLNLVLKAAKQGGKFECDSPLFSTRRVFLFRPDIESHSVSKILAGTRYVLSIGWVLGRKRV